MSLEPRRVGEEPEHGARSTTEDGPLNVDSRPRSTAPGVSYVTMPETVSDCILVLDFLERRFPRVGRDVWRARMAAGAVTDDAGLPVRADAPYCANRRIRYHREVEQEPVVPFRETVVFQNEEFLVACKPHFLPVIPSGPYVNECLLYRLRKSMGLEDLVPVNRLDRETAGLVLFSVNKTTRRLYGELFRLGQVAKRYEAVGLLPPAPEQRDWRVESRIVRGSPWFLSKN